MNSERIKSILADEDFTALVDQMKAGLTKKVMAKGTSDEDRADALTTFHCLDTLTAKMRSEAQNIKDKS